VKTKLTAKQLGERMGTALVRNTQLAQCYLRILVRLSPADREEAVATAVRLWAIGEGPDQKLNSLFLGMGDTI